MGLLAVLTSLVFCALVAQTLRPLQLSSGPVRLLGFDGVGVLLAFVAFVAIAGAMGIGFAASVLAAFGVHEAGRVLAHRMLGHEQTTYRFIPIVTGAPISLTPPRNDGELAFVSLMGAGLSLAPMALSLSLWAATAPAGGALPGYFLVFGTALGAVNFVLLLPFWRLPGRNCADVAARAFWPALGPGLSAFLGAAFLAAGMRHNSLALMLLGAYGLSSIFRKRRALVRAMPSGEALIALAAYTFTLAAHFSATLLLIDALI